MIFEVRGKGGGEHAALQTLRAFLQWRAVIVVTGVSKDLRL